MDQKNNNGQNNGQQVRIQDVQSSKKSFLKSAVTSTTGKVVMGIVGAAAAGTGIYFLRRYIKAKKAANAAAQEPAAPATEQPKK